MSDVITAGLLMGSILGLSVGLVIAIGRSHWWSKIIAIVTCFGIFFGFGCLIGQEHNNDANRFNNGICEQCGGEYRISGATRIRMGSETFYYTCQDCGWTIEVGHLMNKQQEK